MKNKKIISGLLAFAITLVALVAFAQTPIEPWVQKISGIMSISKGGVASLRNPASEQEGNYPLGVARFIYDVSADGGSVGAKSLGVYLPARAVIVRSYFKIITQFSDSGSGTVALHCEDANNIKTATDITGSSANAFVEGQSTGAASAFVRGIGASCQITATVAGVAQDAGKLIGWVEYVLEN